MVSVNETLEEKLQRQSANMAKKAAKHDVEFFSAVSAESDIEGHKRIVLSGNMSGSFMLELMATLITMVSKETGVDPETIAADVAARAEGGGRTIQQEDLS